MTDAAHPLDQILSETDALHAHVFALLEQVDFSRDERTEVVGALLTAANEHCVSLMVLMAAGNAVSSTVLLRAQYETITRAIWALYFATDTWITNAHSPPSLDSPRSANNKPGLADMLDQLKTCAASGGERGAWRMLDEFKRVSWGPLSSYVHGGHHAIHRSATGFPVPIARDVIRNSNGLLMVALIFVASVDGEGALISSVKEISERYAECLPPLLPIPNS